MLVNYIRKNEKLIGCVVGLANDEKEVGVGVSLCNSKDKFNKDIALKIAIGRAYKSIEHGRKGLPGWSDNNKIRHEWIPESKKKFVEEAYENMLKRCVKYYA